MRYHSDVCIAHVHDEPRPCVVCCYIDNGMCNCECHDAGESA